MSGSDERELLRETVAALVAKHASPAAVREAMESERGYDESLWRLLCEQVGAAALVVPEEFGGAGGTLGDAAVVLEELGKNLVPSPLLGTTLAELALLAADEPDADALGSLAEGAAIGAVVFDRDYVINGDVADVVIEAHDGTLERWTEFDAEAVTPMDPTRRLARLTPSNTTPLGTDPGVADAAAILLAAEQIGAAARCLELTVDYTKERQQFGRRDRQLSGTQAPDGRPLCRGAGGSRRGERRRRRPVTDRCGAGPRRGQRGVQHGRRRRHPVARRHRDHLGTRHAAVLQTRTWQFATAGFAARSLAPARIRSVLTLTI